jgi:hypothetical protein
VHPLNTDPPNDSKFAGSVILANDTQLLNNSKGNSVIWGGRLADVSPEPLNTLEPSVVKSVNPPIFKVVREVHPENAFCCIVIKPVACDKSKFRDVQLWNAASSINVNSVNGVNDVSDVQFRNAACEIVINTVNDVNDTNDVQL